MNHLLGKRTLFVAVILVAGCLVLIGGLAPDTVVLRRKLMESNNSAVAEAINKAIKEKNFSEIPVKVNVVMENMDKVLDYFPSGSLSENSRAKPEIWQKWDEFSKNPSRVKKAAQELAIAASARNDEAVKARFKALGEACKNCHSSFRAPKPKKEEELR